MGPAFEANGTITETLSAPETTYTPLEMTESSATPPFRRELVADANDEAPKLIQSMIRILVPGTRPSLKLSVTVWVLPSAS